MNWGFEQAYSIALNMLIALGGAALIALVAMVLTRMPKTGNWFVRVWGGVRTAPWISSILALVIVACLAIVGIGWAIGERTPDTGDVGASESPSPSGVPTTEVVEGGGWGPGRDLASIDNRPTSPMLNSVVDHPTVGDERNFMRIRLADDPNAAYVDNLVVEAGKVYSIGVFVFNDARGGGGEADGVRLRLEVPGVVLQGDAVAQARVTSSNTSIPEIWDGITLVGEEPSDAFAIRYVSASAVLQTGGDANGVVLADEVFTDGVLLGCDTLDGRLPGKERCEAYVTFKVRIDKPNFTALVLAQEGEGVDSWVTRYVANAGDQTQIDVSYENTGTTMQDDVLMRVALPRNLQYLTGSTTLMSTNHSAFVPVSDGIVGESGINVGSFAPGESVHLRFTVTIDGSPEPSTSVQTVDDFLTVFTSSGSKTAPLTLVWPQ